MLWWSQLKFKSHAAPRDQRPVPGTRHVGTRPTPGAGDRESERGSTRGRRTRGRGHSRSYPPGGDMTLQSGGRPSPCRGRCGIVRMCPQTPPCPAGRPPGRDRPLCHGSVLVAGPLKTAAHAAGVSPTKARPGPGGQRVCKVGGGGPSQRMAGGQDSTWLYAQRLVRWRECEKCLYVVDQPGSEPPPAPLLVVRRRAALVHGNGRTL